jgi:hypothetical protein
MHNAQGATDDSFRVTFSRPAQADKSNVWE